MQAIIDLIKQIFASLFPKKANTPSIPDPVMPEPTLMITNNKIKVLYPRIWERCQKLINKIKEQSLDADIFMSFRSFDEQAKLYAKGRTEPGAIVTNSKPGYSFHNYGLALDVVFKKDGKWSWDQAHDWALLGKLGKELGFNWGGDWGWDKPHFELNFGHKIEDLLAIFNKNKDLDEVWAHLDSAPEPA